MASDEIPARQRWATAAGAADAEIASIPTPLLRRADPIAFVGGKLAAALIAPLKAAKFATVAVEHRHPILADLPPEAADLEAFGNGYGEVHNARAFRQLVERAMRTFSPKEDRWAEGGRVIDPFRPALRYVAASDREFDVLQERYLNVVRTAFRRARTLVVALSASEVWEAQADGAVFPGVAGAGNPRFDADRHAVRTLTIDETVADLAAAVTALRGVNAGLEIVLMVSPEPQSATALPVHVLAAATVGKAVLRIAMETAAQADGVHYFPALEIASRQIGLGGYPAEGAVPAEVVSAVTDALLAISEGGAVAFDGGSPPIVATPAPSPATLAITSSTELPEPEPVDAPAPPKRAGAAARPKTAAKPKTVSAQPVDAYSELRAAEEKKKQERRAAKQPLKDVADGEDGAPSREDKQAERQAKRHDKVASREANREAKRTAAADEKRAALAEGKQAREAKRAARSAGAGTPTGDGTPAPKRHLRKAAAANLTASGDEGGKVEPAAPKRGKRRGANAASKPAALAPDAAPVPAGQLRRRAKALAAAAPATAADGAPAPSAAAPAERPRRARKAKSADDAGGPAPAAAGESSTPRPGRRRGRAKTA